MPDLSVKNIRPIPVFPKEGEPVMFLASLINNGTGATQIGDNHLIRFYVEGKEVAHYYSNTAAIPVGGMVQICAQSTNNTNWIAQKGTFNLTAKIEIAENKDLNKQNNACDAQLTISNGRAIPVEIAKIIKK